MPVFTSSIELSDDYPSVEPSLKLNFAGSRSLDPCITFTRSSVGTYVGRDGLIKTAGNNEPRFDHDPETLESLGLLIEEEKTNLIVNSVINTANWNNSASQLLNNTSETKAPDGTNTACKYIPNNGSIGWVSVYNTGNVISMTSGTTYTYSVWAKPTHSDFTGFRINGDIRDAGGINISANFVLSGDGSVSGTYDSASITKYPNGWYRCVATGTADATTNEEPAFQTSASGDGTKGFYAWGYQVEVGVFATSYIPTSGSSVTRTYDNAEIIGENFTNNFNTLEGTFVAECDRGNDGTEGAGIGAMRALTNSYFDMIQFGEFYDNAGATGRVYIGGTSQAQIGATHTTGQGVYNRYAFAYKKDSFAGAINGVGQGEDTSGNVPTILVKFLFGGYDDNRATQNLDGHIKYFYYYPKRLTNAQLQLLTA